MVRCRPGYFVPYRDERGRIQALQVRLDSPLTGKAKYLWLSSAGRDGGASSGAPVHHAQHHLLADAEEVTVTEGALKADVIGFLTQAPVIGVTAATLRLVRTILRLAFRYALTMGYVQVAGFGQPGKIAFRGRWHSARTIGIGAIDVSGYDTTLLDSVCI